jgi:hypothetical protein
MTFDVDVSPQKLKGYKAYPPNWSSIRKFIRERDSNTCQHCGAKHGELRTSRTGKVYKTALCVAHLDHDKENWDVSMDRLLLLCQPCHLKNDRENNQAKLIVYHSQLNTPKETQLDKLRIELRDKDNQIRELCEMIREVESILLKREAQINGLTDKMEENISIFWRKVPYLPKKLHNYGMGWGILDKFYFSPTYEGYEKECRKEYKRI